MRLSIVFSRAGRALAFAPVMGATLSAAVWVDPNWALIGELRTVGVYDSNLTARNDNTEDYYGALTPKLTLSRRGSASRIELDAQVERTWFRDFTEFNSTDPQVNFLFEHPVREEGDEPTSHLDLHWGRDSTTNTDLGRRVRNEYMRGRWDQRVMDTGRTVIDLRLDGRSLDYRDEDLNTNEAFAFEARVGYSISPQTRLGLGYGHEWSRSDGGANRPDTDGDEDRVMVRLFGELLPKLKGSLETGVAWVSYDGAVVRDDTAWIAAASLQWDPVPEASAAIRASRYTDFTPDGATALRSEVMIDLTRRVGRGFLLRGGGGVARTSQFFDDVEQRANAVILTAAIGYQLTERFSAELSERYTRQSANRDVFDYERHLVTGEVEFTF
jgi:hypothetical protein